MSGGTKFRAGIDLQGQKAANAAPATEPTDLITLQQLQEALADPGTEVALVKVWPTGQEPDWSQYPDGTLSIEYVP